MNGRQQEQTNMATIIKKIEHTTTQYCVIARNLPDRTNSNKEDLGTAGVVLAYLFIINTLYTTRTAGQPVCEKP